MKRKLFTIIFALAFFCVTPAHTAPTPTKQAPKNATADVSVYTYSSACPYAANERQTIVFNNKTPNNGFTKTYIYQHGDVSWDYPQYCGQAGFCSKALNVASKYLMIGFRISESVDGSTWSKNYPFNCLYTEAKNVLQGLQKSVPNDTILVSYSRGGAAMETALTKNSEMPSNIKVVYSIWLDSCFANQCKNVAKMSSSKRGAMFVYVSTGDTNNNNSQKTQEATKDMSLTDNVYLAKVAGDHGDVGYGFQCGWDFVLHDNCKNKVSASFGKAGSVTGSGGMAPPGEDWVGDLGAYPAGGGGGSVTTINNISVWSALTAKEFTDQELLGMITKPALKIELPGVKFSEPLIGEEQGMKFFYFPFLSEYLAAVYQYTIAVASAIAVVIIILNGFRLAFSGGASEKISAAKNGITHAIIGLLIAVGSYTLLYTINPELVNFRNLKVYLIDTVILDNTEQEMADGEGFSTAASGNISNAEDVGSDMFEKETINGQKVDGWQAWQKLTPAQQATVMPFLFRVAGDCPVGKGVAPNITITGGKNVHPNIKAAVENASKIAQSYGYDIGITSGIRTLTYQAKLWNTGIIGRYLGGVQSWNTNQGLIAAPRSCDAPHTTGGAIDLGLYKGGKQVLRAGNTADKTSDIGDYTEIFLKENPPYKLILEEIMRKAGFVRFCKEYWHFETKIDNRLPLRANAYDKQPTTRCVATYDNWHIEIPQSAKDNANKNVVGGNLF